MDKDIARLREILKLEGREDIADLLKLSSSQIVDSGQFGSYANSILSTFEIYSPLRENHELRKLAEQEQSMILDALIELYPHRDNAPEITSVSYFIKEEEAEAPSIARAFEPPKKENAPRKVIKTFISYSSKDKHIAGTFKKRLEDLGIGLEVFLAHEDIMGSKEWEDEIIYSLGRSEIFMPLITDNFYDSEWTDQESGMARITKQLVIPICWKVPPQGFMKRYQAIFVKEDNYLEVFSEIHEIISQHEILGKHIVDAAIAQFVESGSFDETRRQFRNIRQIKQFSPEQIQTLVRGCNDNSQISMAWNIEGLFSLLEPYKDTISASDWRRFEELFAPKAAEPVTADAVVSTQ